MKMLGELESEKITKLKDLSEGDFFVFPREQTFRLFRKTSEPKTAEIYLSAVHREIGDKRVFSLFHKNWVNPVTIFQLSFLSGD